MIRVIGLILSACLSASAHAAEPTLTLITPKKTVSFTRAELVQRAESKPLVIDYDATYKKQKMSYQVVPVTALFEGLGISKESIIQFKCLDGYSAPLETEFLFNESPRGSRAYIAIEDPAHPWPGVKGGKATAGPFYLVWKDPKLSDVGQEQWPFQLAAFEVKAPLRETFPRIMPALSASKQVHRGLKLFVKSCFACHTVNHAGESQMGPDLNVPYNPTEYLKADFLRKLIRDPQSLRHWPQAKMLGFTKEALSDAQLDDLLAYFRHMAGRKSTH